MFGTGAGLIALALITFDPTLLAHAALMTTDAGQACFMFCSVYAFYRYAKSPSKRRLVIVGLAAGMTLASKHSAVLLFPILLLLATAELVSLETSPRGEVDESVSRRAFHFAATFLVVVLLSVGKRSSRGRAPLLPEGLAAGTNETASVPRVPHQSTGRSPRDETSLGKLCAGG
jgi:dolichyl-phosphate-mannose--protein O-mannosyl transferase